VSGLGEKRYQAGFHRQAFRGPFVRPRFGHRTEARSEELTAREGRREERKHPLSLTIEPSGDDRCPANARRKNQGQITIRLPSLRLATEGVADKLTLSRPHMQLAFRIAKARPRCPALPLALFTLLSRARGRGAGAAQAGWVVPLRDRAARTPGRKAPYSVPPVYAEDQGFTFLSCARAEGERGKAPRTSSSRREEDMHVTVGGLCSFVEL
jgi:hypothetical protein